MLGRARGYGGSHWVVILVNVKPEALSIHPHGVSRLVRAAKSLRRHFESLGIDVILTIKANKITPFGSIYEELGH